MSTAAQTLAELGAWRFHLHRMEALHPLIDTLLGVRQKIANLELLAILRQTEEEKPKMPIFDPNAADMADVFLIRNTEVRWSVGSPIWSYTEANPDGSLSTTDYRVTVTLEKI